MSLPADKGSSVNRPRVPCESLSTRYHRGARGNRGWAKPGQLRKNETHLVVLMKRIKRNGRELSIQSGDGNFSLLLGIGKRARHRPLQETVDITRDPPAREGRDQNERHAADQTRP